MPNANLAQPITKEQTQNPSLPFGKSSAGTEYSYENPLPTDIRMLVTQGIPGTNVSPNDASSDTGSLIQPIPDNVPYAGSFQSSGYGMSPQNGDHFKYYFANNIGNYANTKVPFPATVLSAIQEQPGVNSDGSSNVWHGAFQTFATMRKGYQGVKPANLSGLKYS
jgi:hypothetical protein